MRKHGWFRPHVRGLTAISSTTLREGVGVRVIPYTGDLVVTNREALAPFMAKLLGPAQDVHVIGAGDSIAAGFDAEPAWRDGWFGLMCDGFRDVFGDGGSFIPCVRDEPYSVGSDYHWPNLSKPFGWSQTSSRTCFGGRTIYTTGTGTTAWELIFPAARYVEPVVTKRSASAGTLRFAIEGVNHDVPTLDAGLPSDAFNQLTSFDLSTEAQRNVTISQITSGNGYIEGIRFRKNSRGIIDYNIGVSGFTLATIASRFTTDALRQAFIGAGCVTPDLLTINIGYNDYGSTTEAAAEAAMTDFINGVKSLGMPILVVIYPPGSGDGTMAARYAYYSAIAAAALAAAPDQVCIVDMNNLWTDVTTAIAAGYYIEADKTHPTDLGHARWAEELLAAIEAPVRG